MVFKTVFSRIDIRTECQRQSRTQLEFVIMAKQDASLSLAEVVSIPVGTASRDILCVDQGLDVCLVVCVVDDAVDFYVSAGDARIGCMQLTELDQD